MTVTVNRLIGGDNTNGDKQFVKLGGSLSFSGKTLVDGGANVKNGEAGNIVKGEVIYKTGVNDEWKKADATDSTTAPLTGSKYAIVFDATIATTATGVAIQEGRIDGILTGATAGDVYYLDTTAGDLTTTAPTADDNVLVKLGHAINATDFFVDVQEPIEQ